MLTAPQLMKRNSPGRCLSTTTTPFHAWELFKLCHLSRKGLNLMQQRFRVFVMTSKGRRALGVLRSRLLQAADPDQDAWREEDGLKSVSR